MSKNISPELACEAIESVRVRGIFHASDEVKATLAGKIK
jgi:hypothetical protein